MGDPCDATTGCSLLDRLFCNEDGVCELVGDGLEGARCKPFDMHAVVDCEPGFVCLDPDPTDPGETVTDGGIAEPPPPAWSVCGKPRAAGEKCQENDDCASQHCLPDDTCGDAYCCDSYSCQSN